MKRSTVHVISVVSLIAVFAGCGSATKTSTPTTPTAPLPPAIVIQAPVPVSPADGAVVTSWPTFTVNNATRTGPVGSLAYRFEVATASDFSNISITSTVAEGGTQTSFTPTGSFPADQTTLYWRATAIDPTNAVQSPASAPQSVKCSNPPTRAAQIAAQQGVVLWSRDVPPGAPGNAVMSKGWDVGMLTSFDGIRFLSPELDQLQIFDCLDRGMSPQQALDWLRSHGYATAAVWYPQVAAIGFSHQYMALVGGRWELVLRAGA